MFTTGSRLFLVDFGTNGTVTKLTRSRVHFNLDRPTLSPGGLTTEVSYPKTADPSAFLDPQELSAAHKAWATRRSAPDFDSSAAAHKAWDTRRSQAAPKD